MSLQNKIIRQAQTLLERGKPAFLLHVSKTAMKRLATELQKDTVPDKIEIPWHMNTIVVKKTQYLDGVALEWSDITKDQYEAWNK